MWAEDLQKALDPAVWPLRVKVREFIHYSKRNNPGNNQRQGGQLHKPGSSGGGAHDGAGHHPSQQGGEQRGQPQLLASNRYAMLGEDVPGGPPVAV